MFWASDAVAMARRGAGLLFEFVFAVYVLSLKLCVFVGMPLLALALLWALCFRTEIGRTPAGDVPFGYYLAALIVFVVWRLINWGLEIMGRKQQQDPL